MIGGFWRSLPRNRWVGNCVKQSGKSWGLLLSESGVTEHQIIDRALSGDPVAERELYNRHVDRIYRLAYRLAGDEALAQEFTQETFIRAFDRLGQFRGEAAFSTWVHAIARSVVFNGLRKVRRRESREVGLKETVNMAVTQRHVDPDLKERLAAAIDGLPLGYRTVFVMHDIEGYTHEEIGAALGVQTGTSKGQLSRARAKLRESLADFAEGV